MKRRLVAVVAIVAIVGLVASTSAAAEEGITLKTLYDMLVGTNQKIEVIEQRVAELEVKEVETVTSTISDTDVQALLDRIAELEKGSPEVVYDDIGFEVVGLVGQEPIFHPQDLREKFLEIGRASCRERV